MVTIGVDTHKRLVVAVALDAAGPVIARWQGANTPAGWSERQRGGPTQGAAPVWGVWSWPDCVESLALGHQPR